jgi:hypothetical protein
MQLTHRVIEVIDGVRGVEQNGNILRDKELCVFALVERVHHNLRGGGS